MVFQLTFLGPKTKQLVETHTGPEQTKSFPQGRKIQNGDSRNHQDMGYLNRFQEFQERSTKYLEFHIQGQSCQFKALPFGLSTAPIEFNVVAKEVKLMALHRDPIKFVSSILRT